MNSVITKSIILLFIWIIPVRAQDVLTENEIERYIQTISALGNISQSTDSDSDDQQTQFTPGQDTISRTPVTDSLDYLKSRPNYEQFKEIIAAHGFTEPKNWAETGDKIVLAHSAYHLKNNSGDRAPTIDEILSDLEKQQRNVENNAFISAETKNILLNRIQNSIALLNDPNYIESDNISVISPFIGRLNSLFKEPR